MALPNLAVLQRYHRLPGLPDLSVTFENLTESKAFISLNQKAEPEFLLWLSAPCNQDQKLICRIGRVLILSLADIAQLSADIA